MGQGCARLGEFVGIVALVFGIQIVPVDEDAQDNDAPQEKSRQGCTDESCGLRTICPSEQILAGECRQDITYYDDEELDRFAGREADGYTPEEEEQWRDVLYTLQPADLLGWGCPLPSGRNSCNLQPNITHHRQ